MSHSLRIAALLLALPIVGCGPNASVVETETSNLKPIAILFGRYLSQNQGQPPADEAALKAFMQSLPPEEVKSFGVTDPATVFISPRDKKPYVVRYGAAARSSGAEPAVVAYEQEGLNGRRFIATSLGEVREVDAAEFARLTGGAPSTP